jgi:hypothetical protein
MNSKVVFLFPPNWTACVAGPHLALPLLSGIATKLGWYSEVWDLSEVFYRTYGNSPSRHSIVEATRNRNFAELDRLYFDWEDELRSVPLANAFGSSFGLLSGYSFSELASLRLDQVDEVLTGRETVYSKFFEEHVITKLLSVQPQVIGVSIASREQVLPTIQLLREIRIKLPTAFLVVGGNTLTRLRDTTALKVFISLADQVVLFQGDLAFAQLLQSVRELGVERAREQLPKIASDELIPYPLWPVPSFAGIVFDESVGTPVLSYVSTRGCYWGKCHFCAIPASWSRTGYGGSAPAEFVTNQLISMIQETGIRRVKFVDEAIPPSKVLPLSKRLRELNVDVEWEGYARLEPAWESSDLLTEAHAGGLRKLYFGLEQAPSTNRTILGKNDRGNIETILRACNQAGIKVHLFCMVGHPGSSTLDAKATVEFLIDNEALIDTTDLVGFRLDRGTTVPGVRPLPEDSDWSMSLKYEPTQSGVLLPEEVNELELSCQEELWEAVPRLLHPLYRIVGPWNSNATREAIPCTPYREICFDNFSLTA